ncbi:MAG: nodulation protein NfeD [Bacteroidetes bacterium]|jgi:membrane-bound serine protease (ClpP class)|nr:nodulation protein NfeD [Bacteroidota bacterium]MBT6687310.1 nodulation protein NfeD [Bacteroidota bacterium]MBT7143974.1 nodulation protein NfeD [Bacteroidota bacterium]MBT7491113.1 nodulation protein NfeD [Bacteroidota bacterium]
MKKIGIISIILFLSIFAKAENPVDSILVYKFNIKQEIGPAVWRHTQQSFDEAKKINADYVLIHMNTYGGTVDDADSIRTKILNSNIPVIVFIDNNAASAGALISIACDKIYMRKGANIGAATVVDQSGNVVPDKYQSFMRSMMRSTAQAHGQDTIINGSDTTFLWKRDPNIAQAMVDPSIYIEGVIDTGKVLTFTTTEAMQHGFCDSQAEDIKEVLKIEGIENYEIKEYFITPLEKTIGFLVNPYFHGILIMIIIGGIYFELQSPGIGFPSAASVVAALLYFAPLYLEGLAENWEIIIFIVGIILIALEVFAFPGFGVAGVSGIFLVIFGLTLSMVDNLDFEFTLPHIEPIIKALFIVIFSIFLSIAGSIYLSKKLLTSNSFKYLVLNAKQDKNDGFVVGDNQFDSLLGKTGVAATILRPSGKVMIDNDIFDAKAEYGFIENGEKIKVVRHETGQVYVIKS